MVYHDDYAQRRHHWPIWSTDRKTAPDRDETLNPDLNTPPNDAAHEDNEQEQQDR